MVAIVSRSQWGARSPRSRQTVSWGQRQEVTLHYSYGSTSQTPRAIQDHHMDGNGWADIGYNLLVDSDGTAYEGRGWLTVGAHAAPRNVAGIGICYIGRDNMSNAAKRTVVALYDEACRRSGRTLARKGHRDINSTSCPGSSNYQWWKSSNYRDVAGAAGTGEDDASMMGLSEGDSGDQVRYLQMRLRHAGFADMLGDYGPLGDGVDGQYGPSTTAAVLAARHYVGSSADDGSYVNYYAAAQIGRAVARREAERATADQ